MDTRRNTSMLYRVLGHSIHLLDVVKQEGPTSISIKSLVTLGITTTERVVQSLAVSALQRTIAEIEELGSTLIVIGRALTQIGITNVQTVVQDLWKTLDASRQALEATLLSALDLCISTLDRFHHLGVLQSPTAGLYLLFMVYSQLKMAYDFVQFVGSVVGVVFQKPRDRATCENMNTSYVDAGVETEDGIILEEQQWDDSLVTPRSSQRNKKAIGMNGRAPRKSLREVLSEL